MKYFSSKKNTGDSFKGITYSCPFLDVSAKQTSISYAECNENAFSNSSALGSKSASGNAPH